MAKKQSNKTMYHIMVSAPGGWVRLLVTPHLDLNLIYNSVNKEVEKLTNTTEVTETKTVKRKLKR